MHGRTWGRIYARRTLKSRQHINVVFHWKFQYRHFRFTVCTREGRHVCPNRKVCRQSRAMIFRILISWFPADMMMFFMVMLFGYDTVGIIRKFLTTIHH
ncbi:hypothetical protein M758_10G114200 [Ceratodon purpureus]|nr:hypothetical protein M758_10G114200 [Ceratodon purpureus]